MRPALSALPVAALALLLLGATEDAVPAPTDGLSGRDVYACVLKNRFHAYVQEAKLVSGDSGESAQESRLRMTWKNFRDEQEKARAGVLSKTLVRYEHPFDLRFSGYLVINNEERSNDQFVYLAASRRIRRVNLRKEAVFGTDFTFEDIVPAEIEDADYRRLSDVLVDGRSLYVVEVTPKPHADSEYSRFVVYVPRENCVPVRTRYWDSKGVEVKELTVPFEAVKDYDGIHWPMQLTMRNLKLETFTTLTVEHLEPNAKLPDRDFEVRRLMSH
jgi:outer membrane lipoprotein-sorting protein